eukprot:7904773-Ditylum_brightwellii.AAC.1
MKDNQQFDYKLPAKVEDKHDTTQKLTNPSMKYKFEDETFTTATNINQKELMKLSILKLKNKGTFLKWYTNIFTHGLHQGIFIPPLRSAPKEATFGQAWKHLDKIKCQQRDDISYFIGQFLNHEELFPKEAKDLCNIMTAENSNGYIAFYNLLRYMKHPSLPEDVVETSISRQQNAEIFSSYIQLIREKLQSRNYT